MGTSVPLGRLANAELRALKRQTHEVFDPLWRVAVTKKRQAKDRIRAYAALAQVLGISAGQCHIGEFDADLCRRTIAAIPELRHQLSTT